jgi:hypothetical protein
MSKEFPSNIIILVVMNQNRLEGPLHELKKRMSIRTI